MTDLVQDGKHDNTLALLSEGDDFVRNHRARLQTDVFATRLMLRPVVCALGEDAAACSITRGALPVPVPRHRRR
jgi:fatty-acid peroxygenase